MGDSGGLALRATFDAKPLKDGLAEGTTAFKEYAADLRVAFAATKQSTQSAMEGISAATKAAAAQVTADDRAIAESTRSLALVNADVRRSLIALKDVRAPTEALDLYTAGLNRQKEAAAALAAQQQKAVVNQAQSTVTQAASGYDGSDELQIQLAASTQALTSAKAAQAEVTKAVALANLDEATSTQALAAVQATVAAAEADVAAAKAAIIARSAELTSALEAEAEAAAVAAEAARIDSEADALLAKSNASAEAQRLAKALLGKAAAHLEVKRSTDLANASSLDEAGKAALVAPALEKERLALIEIAAAEKEFAASVEIAGEANEVLAQGAGHAVTSMAATSGAIRVFEGALPIRAVENFLTKVLPLGGILQKAFPLIGLIAFGEMAFETGKKLYEAFDLGGERARKTQEQIRDVTNELARSSTQLDVEIDKLQQEQAKLEKKPFNGIKLVMDEAAEATQNLEAKLEGVLKKEDDVIKGMAASGMQKALGSAGTGYEQTMVNEHGKWLGKATSEQQQLNESVSFGQSLQTRLNELQEKQRDNNAASAEVAQAGAGVILRNYSNEIQAVQQMISYQQKEREGIEKQIALEKQQGATQGARDAHAADVLAHEGATAANKAAEEHLKSLEAQRTAEEAAGKLGAQADLDFGPPRSMLSSRGRLSTRPFRTRSTAIRPPLRDPMRSMRLSRRRERNRRSRTMPPSRSHASKPISRPDP